MGGTDVGVVHHVLRDQAVQPGRPLYGHLVRVEDQPPAALLLLHDAALSPNPDDGVGAGDRDDGS